MRLVTPSTYLPIADHGVIGDMRTVALVGTDGSIDWYCCPRFDSPSVFGALLDSERGGAYRIAPVEECSTRQLYLPDTNVLITRFLSPHGVAEVQDFMPVNGPQRLIRRVVGIRGELEFRLECEPRFDYGRATHEVTVGDAGARFVSRELTLALSAPWPLRATAAGATAEFTITAGRAATFALEGEAVPRPLADQESLHLLEDTARYWRTWIARSTYAGRWREMVDRSALTLKLLTYEQTGAIVAAPTTSLPEQLGGARNWDYRFTWIRDASFTLDALLRLGFADEARAFGAFLLDRFRDAPTDGTGPLQIMYGIDGRPDLPEVLLDHLEGYRGSSPVRVGNAAAEQLQLDIYGEIIDAAHRIDIASPHQMPYDAWAAVSQTVDWLCDHWDVPDEGIWETRGGRRRFTYSRLMCWVALDRAIRISRRRSMPADVFRWTSVRDEIFRRLMDRSWSEKRQAFVQHEETDVLDAAVLLMPLVGFISPTDPRWLSTLDAIAGDLVSDSLVYRYDPAAAPDGLDGDEGTFSICSFWYVDALTAAGRLEEARLAFEKMLTYANHVGLYSEQVGSSGEQLGNFPQAFTHLALIRAAVNLDRALDAGGSAGADVWREAA